MKIIFTKAETEELLKRALTDTHYDLLSNAGMGYKDFEKFDVTIKTYDDKEYLSVTARADEPQKTEPTTTIKRSK